MSFSPDCLLRLPLSCCCRRRRRHRLRTSFGLPRTDSRATHQPLGAVKSSGGEKRFYFSGFSLQSGALEGPMYVFSGTQHRYGVVMIDNIYFQFATIIDIILYYIAISIFLVCIYFFLYLYTKEWRLELNRIKVEDRGGGKLFHSVSACDYFHWLELFRKARSRCWVAERKLALRDGWRGGGKILP